MNERNNSSTSLNHVTTWLTLIQSTVQFWGPLILGVVAYFAHAPWYVIIGVVVVAIILFFILRRRIRLLLAARILSLSHRLLPIKKDYECRDKVVEYTYENRETMTLQVSYKVKFNSGTHTDIPERIKWSAGDVENVKSIVTGQTVSIVPPGKKDDILFQLGYQNLQIGLPKRYSKQDGFFPTGYCCICPPDPEHNAMTCLVIGVYQKVRRLTLRLQFDKSLNVINIRKLKYARYQDEEPYDIEPGELKLDKEGKFFYVDFKIKYPIPGGKYAMDWEFSEM